MPLPGWLLLFELPVARRGGKAGGRRGRADGQGAMGLKCSSRAKGRGELPAELPQSVFKIRETELPLKVHLKYCT